MYLKSTGVNLFMRSPDILHSVVNHDVSPIGVRATVVEAHPDDFAMSRLTRTLTEAGVTVSIATATDGAARGTAGYTPKELAAARWDESQRSAKLLGVREVFNAKLPDGQLSAFTGEGQAFLEEVTERTDPDFVIVTHFADPHPDHSAAAEITQKVAVDADFSLYYMDTISGKDKDGELIVPTDYFYVTWWAAYLEQIAYLANETQTQNLPAHEWQDVHNVLTMTERRGTERGVKNAAVTIFDASLQRPDHIRGLLAEQRL